jgi:hypothetical protein
VLTHEPRTGAAEESAQHERDDDRVVELPRHRDEVRHEVEREGEVDEREARRHLPPRGHARIREQALEQYGAVRDQLGDQPNVPLPRADQKRGDEPDVDHDENDGSEEEPVHTATILGAGIIHEQL